MANEVADAGRGVEAPKAKVFISYSRKNMAFADRLEAALKERAFEPLIDRTEIYAFEDWWKRIQALIAEADTFIFVVSPDAVASEVCSREVTFAASLNKRFAPIVYRRVDDKLIPEEIGRLNFIFFDDDALFADGINRLCDALATDIDWIRKHTEFGAAARQWSAGGRPGGLLLRSPLLEQAERWVASRPPNAPAPTEETQTFIAESRRGATRRRNILTGSLAAGLIVALVLAGLAYWQRETAVAERQIAEQQRQNAELQRQRAEDTLTAATKTANGLVFDLAQRFRDAVGIPKSIVKDILDRARGLQQQLTKSGGVTPELRLSEAGALDEIAMTLQAIGDVAGALAAAEQARQIDTELVAADAGNRRKQRDLSISQVTVGDIQISKGDLAGALQSYSDSLVIRQRLADANPDNADLQMVLGISNERVGDVQVARGDLAAALKSYKARHDIISRLAKTNADNNDWQRDLSASYLKVGIAQFGQGDLANALQSYRDGAAVLEGLTKRDPNNADWLNGLATLRQRVGSVLQEQGNLVDALQSYRENFATADRLAKSDPSDAEWQRNLGVSYEKIGDVQQAQGDLAGALTSYGSGFDIRKRLAEQDPGNAGWQRDLALSYEKVGDVQMAQGKFADALQSHRDSLAIFSSLAQSDPSNSGWQGSLPIAWNNIGDAQLAQGNPPAAVASYQSGLAVVDRMAKANPGNTNWQRDLVTSYAKLGFAYLKAKQPAQAREALSAGRDIITAGLDAQFPDWSRSTLAWFDRQFKTLKD